MMVSLKGKAGARGKKVSGLSHLGGYETQFPKRSLLRKLSINHTVPDLNGVQ